MVVEKEMGIEVLYFSFATNQPSAFVAEISNFNVLDQKRVQGEVWQTLPFRFVTVQLFLPLIRSKQLVGMEIMCNDPQSTLYTVT